MFVSSEVVPLTRSRASVKIVDLYSSKKFVSSLSENNSIYFYQVRRHHPSCGKPRTVPTKPTPAPTLTLNPIAAITHGVVSSSSTTTSSTTASTTTSSHSSNKSKERYSNSDDNDGQGANPSRTSFSVVEVEVAIEVGSNIERPATGPLNGERDRDSPSRLNLTASAVVTMQPGSEREINNSDDNIEVKLPESDPAVEVEVEVEVESTVR